MFNFGFAHEYCPIKTAKPETYEEHLKFPSKLSPFFFSNTNLLYTLYTMQSKIKCENFCKNTNNCSFYAFLPTSDCIVGHFPN